MKEWKIYQKIYNSLVVDHSDAKHLHKRVLDPEKIDNAIRYVTEQSDVGIYPAKSYIVAIIYATMLNKVYGEDFYECLNDPDLLFNQDDYFVTYNSDKDTYDAIIEKLANIPNWIDGGWAPKTVEYFYLECTQSGIDSVNGVVTA